MSWSAWTTWHVGNGAATGDAKMMTGYLDKGWGDQAISVNLSPLVISNVSPSGYTVQYDSLATGQAVYIDRAYTFTNVASLGGSTYIKTANDDKLSTGSSFLTFTVNRDCTVYVAHDDAITSKPSWMSTFTDTGANMAHDGSGTSFSLHAKDFSTGTVTLGGNMGAHATGAYDTMNTSPGSSDRGLSGAGCGRWLYHS